MNFDCDVHFVFGTQLATMQLALDQAHADLQQARADLEIQKTQYQVQLELADEMLRAKVRTQIIMLETQFSVCSWPCSDHTLCVE
jgi:hypothetical protein